MSISPANVRKVLGKGGWDRKLYILEAISEFRNAENHAPLNVDELVRLATRQAARKDLNHVLDQKMTRTHYLNLFRQLHDARLGRLIVGRRGHPTRFETWAGHALEYALTNMGIPTFPGQNAPSPRNTHEKPNTDPVDDFWSTSDPPEPTVSPTAATNEDRPTRESVVAELKKHQDEIRNFGVRSLALFGSVARNEATPESDIDLLVTFKDSVTSDGFFGVKFFLEDLLGRRIDLVTDSALREPLRTTIERELVNVA
jgi:predicted nucleotidyltransferase